MAKFKTINYQKKLTRKRNINIVIALFSVIIVIIVMGAITHQYDFMGLLPCNIDPNNLYVPSSSFSSIVSQPTEVELDKLKLKIVDSTCWNGLIYAEHLSAINTITNRLVWTKYESGLFGVFIDEVHNRLYVSGNEYIEAISIVDGLTLWRNVTGLFDHNAHPINVLLDGSILVKLPDNIREIDQTSGALTSTLPLSNHDFNNSAYISLGDKSNRG